MDDLEIFLPCGFTAVYKNLRNQQVISDCLVCKSHKINYFECLELPRNRLNMRQKQVELEWQRFTGIKNEIESIDLNDFVEYSLKKLINNVNKRRDELKNRIDVYYDELLGQIDKIRQSSGIDFLKSTQNADTFSLDEIPDELDIESKIKLTEVNLKKIDENIGLLQKIKTSLEKQNIFEFRKPSEPFEIEKIYGEIVVKTTERKIEKSKTFICHNLRIRDIKFIGNDKILTASFDKTVKLWEKQTGECLNTYTSHSDLVTCLCIINKDHFASGSSDKTIKIWNINSNVAERTLKGHTDWVLCLKVLKNGQLASGSMDSTIKIWNENGRCIKTLLKHSSAVSCLEAAGGVIISGSWDRTIKFWGILSALKLDIYEGHVGKILCIKIINDGYLASGSEDKTIKIWRSDNGECVSTLKGHESWVIFLEKLDGNQIISGSSDGIIKIWRLDFNECIGTLEAHESQCYALNQLNKNEISTGSFEGLMKIWKIF